THFADVAHSSFVQPLRDFFYEGGKTFLQGRALASRRYGRVFGELRAVLGCTPLYFIPGNMDYPQLTELFASACPSIHCLNGTQLEVDGLQIAGAGGIPSACQPFGKVTRISPYELSTEAYTAQLKKV